MEQASHLSNPLVMLVDDCTVDNYVNNKMINHYGFSNRVIIFKRASLALKYLASVSDDPGLENEMPEFIFLDLNMPLINGQQFISEYEKLPVEQKAQCKIVVLSSSINPADISGVVNSPSVFAYMSKPLIKSNLDQLTEETKTFAKAGSTINKEMVLIPLSL